MTKTQKGFTLIELLIVIAIIGILAGAVIYAMKPKARIDQAKAGNIQSELAQIGNPAAVYMSGSSSYAGVCGDAEVQKLLNAVKSHGALETGDLCSDNDNGYVAGFTFDNNGTTENYCVDASGVHKTTEDEANYKCN